MNRKRKCAGCGFEFVSSGPDDVYCSAACAGSIAPGTLLLAAQQIAARLAGRRQ